MALEDILTPEQMAKRDAILRELKAKKNPMLNGRMQILRQGKPQPANEG